jgi:hypothetical protein
MMGHAFTAANLFELASREINVTFSSSSFDGKPQFSYRDRDTSRTFRGDQIVADETRVGRLVSVELEVVPDLRTVTFSLILPTVNIVPGSAGTAVSVPGLVTTSHTSIAGPILGPSKTYRVLTLRGTAQFVEF